MTQLALGVLGWLLVHEECLLKYISYLSMDELRRRSSNDHFEHISSVNEDDGKSRQATGPPRQATGPPRSGAGVGVGTLRGASKI